MTGHPADQAAFAFVGAFVDELARVGIRHVCIAPGSRSTPLALTIASHPALRTWVHLDERSAAFFALGMARMLESPVALLCTSGTAAANLLPAVVEAHSAGVPLLVLTADRPPELRDVGAAQTIDQNRLFGAHAKWFVDVAIPEASSALVRYARTLASRAAARAAAAPAGPVHLNFPFREPLVPEAFARPVPGSAADVAVWGGRPDGRPFVVVSDAAASPDDGALTRIADALATARRPLLVCGPNADRRLAEPLAALARTLHAPLLADPLSQLRWGTHDRAVVVDRYDAVLRDDRMARHLAPDLVLRFGAVPTSKALLQYLQRDAVPHVVVDVARWPDPALLASEMVHAEPTLMAAGLGARVAARAKPAADDAWLATWRRIDDAAADALDGFLAALDGPFEGRAVAEVVAAVPDGGTIVVSSSMPVRDLDAFARGDARRVRVLANRGANGIDGVVSTALGASAARGPDAGPLALVIGDIAFYHDMNGLLAAKLHALDATVVVLNNDGGGIFSFLPQAAHGEHFERLFGTPHGLDFAPVAQLYGARYTRADAWDVFRDAVATGVVGRGLHIVEMRTDRTENVALHRAAWQAVQRRLAAVVVER